MVRKVSIEEYNLLKSIQENGGEKPITEEQYQLLKKHKSNNLTFEPVPGSESLNPKDVDSIIIETGKQKVLYQKRVALIIGSLFIIGGIVIIALHNSDSDAFDGNPTAYGSVMISFGVLSILWAYIHVYLVNKYPWFAKMNTFFGKI